MSERAWWFAGGVLLGTALFACGMFLGAVLA